MANSKLNKQLWTDITRLKLLNKCTYPVKFILKQSPFDEDDDEDGNPVVKREECIITGLISPNSEIYRERSYLIEMKLTKTFPVDPPEVRFLTPIYHPNVERDGTFCNELLQKCATWTRNTSLVNVVRAVVVHIDTPNVDYSPSVVIGREYWENKSEFDRKAMEYVKRHGLPRV